jgi:hypothetical protein
LVRAEEIQNKREERGKMMALFPSPVADLSGQLRNGRRFN